MAHQPRPPPCNPLQILQPCQPLSLRPIVVALQPLLSSFPATSFHPTSPSPMSLQLPSLPYDLYSVILAPHLSNPESFLHSPAYHALQPYLLNNTLTLTSTTSAALITSFAPVIQTLHADCEPLPPSFLLSARTLLSASIFSTDHCWQYLSPSVRTLSVCIADCSAIPSLVRYLSHSAVASLCLRCVSESPADCGLLELSLSSRVAAASVTTLAISCEHAACAHGANVPALVDRFPNVKAVELEAWEIPPVQHMADRSAGKTLCVREKGVEVRVLGYAGGGLRNALVWAKGGGLVTELKVRGSVDVTALEAGWGIQKLDVRIRAADLAKLDSIVGGLKELVVRVQGGGEGDLLELVEQGGKLEKIGVSGLAVGKEICGIVESVGSRLKSVEWGVVKGEEDCFLGFLCALCNFCPGLKELGGWFAGEVPENIGGLVERLRRRNPELKVKGAGEGERMREKEEGEM